MAQRRNGGSQIGEFHIFGDFIKDITYYAFEPLNR
jgi:hypothetical protein